MIPSRSSFRFRFLLLALLPLAGPLRADEAPAALVLPAGGSLRFEVRDHLRTPAYAWPRTLIGYPVDFSRAHVKPDRLALTGGDDHGARPFQLSEVRLAADGTLAFARVNFFCDLPPGADRVFELAAGEAPSAAADGKVTERAEGNVITLDAGSFQVRLPASRAVSGSEAVPGPLLALNDGKGWIGESRLTGGKHAAERIETKRLEGGDLFRTYQVAYSFPGGARYVATIRAVLGYPFVEFSEKMTGFAPEDGAMNVMRWTGFTPTKRYAAGGWLMNGGDGIGIDEPVITPGLIEMPRWWPQNVVEDPAREMLYRLSSYSGNSVREGTPAIDFYDDRPGGRELGVFVPDTLGWNDGQYMTWEPTARLDVRFRYADRTLSWSWPLVDGTRATGIALQDTARAEAPAQAALQTFRDLGRNHRERFEGNTYSTMDQVRMRSAQWLRSWYGGLHLDRVKDWVLTSPATAPAGPPLFDRPEAGWSPAHLEDAAFSSAFMLYPLGLNLTSMNINHRVVRPLTQEYSAVRTRLAPDQKERIDALFLLSAYVNAGEDLAPVRTCMTGCPNMSADGFCMPSAISALFPGHPMVPAWRDQFAKIIQLMGCFYTRPEVPAWDARGGRWTESLSTYNWGYFVPTFMAQEDNFLCDGINRMATAEMAARGRWLVDELSAPVHNPDPYWRQDFKNRLEPPPLDPAWHPGMDLAKAYGFERQYPPHGAHGTGTGIPVPPYDAALAAYLMRYDPLTAEHLLWAFGQATSRDHGEYASNFWVDQALRRVKDNDGTRPVLETCKYTGHGLILRAGVGTPEEVSIHLDQTDLGPDYRWGDNGEGSSGVLYYYAQGRVWSGHERENTGDHENDDTTGTTTFGAVNRGAYRSIGANVLDRPLYDLGVAQFGELAARQGPDSYGWPAYKSRSAMLVGTDYLILADEAVGDGRFSWFTARDLPFPKIVFLDPLSARQDHWEEVRTPTSHGIMRDTIGSSVALVTHRGDGVEMEDMQSAKLPYVDDGDFREYSWKPSRGVKPVPGAYHVRTPTSDDRVFRAFAPVAYADADDTFNGRAGVIRHRHDGSTELALFQGERIGAAGVTLEVPAASVIGIGAAIPPDGPIRGWYSAQTETPVTLHLDDSRHPAALRFYVDGHEQAPAGDHAAPVLRLPAGRHSWEATSTQPLPPAPAILATHNRSGGASVLFAPVAGATGYRLEVSDDGEATWRPAAQGASSPLEVSGLPNGRKVHLRLVAFNPGSASAPSADYPLYVGDQPPPSPEGLDARLGRDRVDLTWGQVLGVTEYRLYRRERGADAWKLLYHGPDTHLADTTAAGVVPPHALPGPPEKGTNEPAPAHLYEYAVAAANDNGEGAKSLPVDTDPASWRNWWPAGKERVFQRQTAFLFPPYVGPGMTPPPHYPASSP